MSSNIVNLPQDVFRKIETHLTARERANFMNTSSHLRTIAKTQHFDYYITSDVFQKAYSHAVNKLRDVIDSENIDYNKEIDKFTEINKLPINSLINWSILYLKSINVKNPKNPKNLKNILNLANCYGILAEKSETSETSEKYKFLKLEFSKMYILNYILGKHKGPEFSNALDNVLNTSKGVSGHVIDTIFLLCIAYIKYYINTYIERNVNDIYTRYNDVFDDSKMPPFALPSLGDDGTDFWGSLSKYNKIKLNIYKICIDYIANTTSTKLSKKNSKHSTFVIDTDTLQEEEEKPAAKANKRRIQKSGSRTVVISNLDFRVTADDIYDLLSNIGTPVSVIMNSDGRNARVLFSNPADAVRAVNEFNNVPLDGRPMRVESMA